MHTYRTLADVDLQGKRVLVRAGFDIPMEEGRITDESRIVSVIPTIRFLLDHGAAVIIIAHQDRPKGKVIPGMSQKPLVPVLERLLDLHVQFAPSCTGPETEQIVDDLAPGQVLLLENLRFDAREEANDEVFAQELASYANLYVNEAFTNCHREHASMTGITKFLPSYMGLGLEQEVMHLSAVTDSPVRPLSLIVSGAKIETKLPVIDAFMKRGDHVFVGGAIANTFLLAQGVDVGSSLVEPSFKDQALAMIAASGTPHHATLHLPSDAVAAPSPDQSLAAEIVELSAIGSKRAMFDIGPKTVEQYILTLDQSASIVWNGPLGMYEKKEFAEASMRIAEALRAAAARGVTVIVGGGDTIDFHTRYGLDMSAYTFVSTGGGAMLDFVAGEDLPALEALAVR
jgi:phosphoglycerate kinase